MGNKPLNNACPKKLEEGLGIMWRGGCLAIWHSLSARQSKAFFRSLVLVDIPYMLSNGFFLHEEKSRLVSCLRISTISRRVIEGALCLPASSPSSLAICNNSTTAARSSKLEWTHYTIAPLPTQRQEVLPLKQKAHPRLLPAHPQHPTSSGRHQHPLAQQQPCFAPGPQTRSHSTGWSYRNWGSM
jgi:hypothetical protein